MQLASVYGLCWLAQRSQIQNYKNPATAAPDMKVSKKEMHQCRKVDCLAHYLRLKEPFFESMFVSFCACLFSGASLPLPVSRRVSARVSVCVARSHMRLQGNSRFQPLS